METLKFNIDEVTLGDIEDFEEMSGLDWDDLDFSGGNIPMKALKALIFIMKRQNDPNVTVADIRKITVREMTSLNTALANPQMGSAEDS